MINISDPQVLNPEDASDLVNRSDKLIFFFDTCSFLDILRFPLPDRGNSIDMHNDLISIKDLIVQEDAFCLSSELCIQEFNDHAPSIFHSYEAQIDRMLNPVNKYIDIVNLSGLTSNSIPNINLKNYHLENYFSDIATTIIDKTIFVEEQTFRDAAHVRLIDKEPPALKKGEYKDCIIWETFIHVLNNKNDHQNYSFFISSNKTDYCELPGTRDFHPSLQSEVDGLNAYFALTFTNFHQRLQELNIL